MNGNDRGARGTVASRGVDLLGLPTGALLHIGDQVVVEVTGLRNPCTQIDDYQKGLLRYVARRDEDGNVVRKAGIMGIVRAGGAVHRADRIRAVLPEPRTARSIAFNRPDNGGSDDDNAHLPLPTYYYTPGTPATRMASPGGNTNVIRFDRVTVSYPGGGTPLDGISTTLGSGTTAVMGPSGSGKSTMLRLAAGMQAPTSGTVTIDGARVATASWRSGSDPRVSMIHQDYRLVPFLTVEENLLLAAELRGRRPSAADVEGGLERVGLESSVRDRLPVTMSGGEQQRVAIARALVAASPVILADEPTGALDVDNTRRVTEILLELGSNADLTIVVATHDPNVAQPMHRCLSLGGGGLVGLA